MGATATPDGNDDPGPLPRVAAVRILAGHRHIERGDWVLLPSRACFDGGSKLGTLKNRLGRQYDRRRSRLRRSRSNRWFEAYAPYLQSAPFLNRIQRYPMMAGRNAPLRRTGEHLGVSVSPSRQSVALAAPRSDLKSIGSSRGRLRAKKSRLWKESAC
jgi:hypothetical protein